MSAADSARSLPLAELAAGMVLAQPVTDASGQVLLPAGATLSASHLGALARRGIEAVTVRVEMQLSEAEKAAHRARLQACFGAHLQHVPNQQLYRWIVHAFGWEDTTEPHP